MDEDRNQAHPSIEGIVSPPPAEEALPSQLQAKENLADMTLLDGASFRGVVDDEGKPHGLGVLYAALGTHVYAGEFQRGAKCGLGVQLLPNGTIFAGDFEANYASGDGVKRDPFGGQFIGQWQEGELHGYGLSVNADGDMTWGVFERNELSQASDTMTWEQTQPHILRAVLAEKKAVQIQEKAREKELRVLLQGLAMIGTKTFNTGDEIAAFINDTESTLLTFLYETKQALAQVEQASDKWKFQEAQLKEQQKDIRREIEAKRAELSYLAKFVGLAEERQAQVADAERTLELMHKQIDFLQELATKEATVGSEEVDRK